jgi:hypothetical protein
VGKETMGLHEATAGQVARRVSLKLISKVGVSDGGRQKRIESMMRIVVRAVRILPGSRTRKEFPTKREDWLMGLPMDLPVLGCMTGMQDAEVFACVGEVRNHWMKEAGMRLLAKGKILYALPVVESLAALEHHLPAGRIC